MSYRDRIVAGVLGGAVLLGLLAWKETSPWAGLVVAIVGLLAAAAVYRVETTAETTSPVEAPESRVPDVVGR